METALINKVHKAKKYAQDRTRFKFVDFTVSFRGSNANHQVTLHEGKWGCDCEFFDHHTYCAHTMALERLLEGMLPPELDA